LTLNNLEFGGSPNSFQIISNRFKIGSQLRYASDGNDLDLQFENDNALKFYTAAGGHLTYAPRLATLVNQWHMIVATLDAVSQTRVIYWDGKPVATDKGGGRAGKKNIFAIGASPVASGQFA
jgi:hypothetical protein